MKKRIAVFAVLFIALFLFLGCNENPVVRIINNTSLTLEVWIDLTYLGDVSGNTITDFPVEIGVHYIYCEDIGTGNYVSTYTNALETSGCSNEPNRFDYTITSTKAGLAAIGN